MPDAETKSKVDSTLGTLVWTFMGLIICMGFLVPLLESSSPRGITEQILWFAGLVWALVTEGWLVLTAWSVVLRNLHPVAPAVAIRQPRLPWLFRPLPALWWLFQLLMGSAWTLALAIGIGSAAWYATALLTALSWGFSYATYGFALLSVTAFTRTPRTLLSIWRFRSAYAALFGLLTALSPLWHSLLTPHQAKQAAGPHSHSIAGLP